MTAGPCKSLASKLARWLVLAAVLAGCRDRPHQAPAIDWQVATVETAALLLQDGQGAVWQVCLPGSPSPRPLPAGTPVRRIMDVAWKDGLRMAASAPDADETFLLAPPAEPRRLGQDVRDARFSPNGDALAYQVQEAGATFARPTSFVLDLVSGRLTELAGLADPRWEADSEHLRATLLREDAQDGPMRSLRARWDRQSESTALLGPGSAQIPAPTGEAVAWSPDQRGPNTRSACVVRLGQPGGVQVPHNVQGEFCLGLADDRGVRWSDDGQWLAFPHPGPVPGGHDPSKSFLDVVTLAGGRTRELMTLHNQVGPAASELAVAPASVWFDWSPQHRFLAVQDGVGDLRVYDFQAHGIAALGKGDRPRWSPGGAYLLISASSAEGAEPHIFVLSGAAPSARMDLGPATDARWLPVAACDG